MMLHREVAADHKQRLSSIQKEKALVMSAFSFIYLLIRLHSKVFILLFLYFICTSLFLSRVLFLERQSLDCLSNDSMNIS